MDDPVSERLILARTSVASPDPRPLEDFLDRPYRIVLARDEQSSEWVARVDELAGCEARGKTVVAAADAVVLAMRDWFERAVAEGREIPVPRQSTYSGRLLVRMSRDVHGELARRAEAEGVSLNQLITGILAASLETEAGAVVAAESSPTQVSASLRALLYANMLMLVFVGAVALALLVYVWRHVG